MPYIEGMETRTSTTNTTEDSMTEQTRPDLPALEPEVVVCSYCGRDVIESDCEVVENPGGLAPCLVCPDCYDNKQAASIPRGSCAGWVCS